MSVLIPTMAPQYYYHLVVLARSSEMLLVPVGFLRCRRTQVIVLSFNFDLHNVFSEIIVVVLILNFEELRTQMWPTYGQAKEGVM